MWSIGIEWTGYFLFGGYFLELLSELESPSCFSAFLSHAK